jgi:hypothetical protein
MTEIFLQVGDHTAQVSPGSESLRVQTVGRTESSLEGEFQIRILFRNGTENMIA